MTGLLEFCENDLWYNGTWDSWGNLGGGWLKSGRLLGVWGGFTQMAIGGFDNGRFSTWVVPALLSKDLELKSKFLWRQDWENPGGGCLTSKECNGLLEWFAASFFARWWTLGFTCWLYGDAKEQEAWGMWLEDDCRFQLIASTRCYTWNDCN